MKRIVLAAVFGILGQSVSADAVFLFFNPQTGYLVSHRMENPQGPRPDLSQCGRGCRVAGFAQDGWCTALAEGETDRAGVRGYGVDRSPTSGMAQQGAVFECSKIARNCRPIAAICSEPK